MLTIWHNPACSKSRTALELLTSSGHAPRIRLYLDDPPTEEELSAALAALGVSVRALLRSSEAAYQALGLADPALSDATLMTAMAEKPVLIERPIVFGARRAVIARPPERALEVA